MSSIFKKSRIAQKRKAGTMTEKDRMESIDDRIGCEIVLLMLVVIVLCFIAIHI